MESAPLHAASATVIANKVAIKPIPLDIMTSSCGSKLRIGLITLISCTDLIKQNRLCLNRYASEPSLRAPSPFYRDPAMRCLSTGQSHHADVAEVEKKRTWKYFGDAARFQCDSSGRCGLVGRLRQYGAHRVSLVLAANERCQRPARPPSGAALRGLALLSPSSLHRLSARGQHPA